MTINQSRLAYDFDLVAARLGEAGMALLALRVSGLRPAGMRCYWPDIPGSETQDDRPAVPSPRRISEMDEALGWISLIPEKEIALRKLVGARALTSPRNGKPLFSWKQLAKQIDCSDATAKAWWTKGIDIIVRRLNQPSLCELPQFRGTRSVATASVRSAATKVRSIVLEPV